MIRTQSQQGVGEMTAVKQFRAMCEECVPLPCKHICTNIVLLREVIVRLACIPSLFLVKNLKDYSKSFPLSPSITQSKPPLDKVSRMCHLFFKKNAIVHTPLNSDSEQTLCDSESSISWLLRRFCSGPEGGLAL